MKKLIGLLILLTAIVGMSLGTANVLPVSAEDNSGLAAFEKLHPLSAQDEASIVHVVPSVPVIVDGKFYKPEEIALFNGHRLNFAVGIDGQLYAFTSAADLDTFMSDLVDKTAINRDNFLRLTWAGTMCWDWYYGDPRFDVFDGGYYATLGDWNNQISSAIMTDNGEIVTLYDYENAGGDTFNMMFIVEDQYTMLWVYGWNDRASSLYSHQ